MLLHLDSNVIKDLKKAAVDREIIRIGDRK